MRKSQNRPLVYAVFLQVADRKAVGYEAHVLVATGRPPYGFQEVRQKTWLRRRA